MPVFAVVDTSVLVSAFINPAGYPAMAVEAARRGRYVPVMSPQLLDELQQVLARPRILRAIKSPENHAGQFLQDLGELTKMVDITGSLRLCRDVTDDMVLETAIRGHASYVVSRDGDIVRSLDLMQRLEAQGIRAVTVSHFLKELSQLATSS